MNRHGLAVLFCCLLASRANALDPELQTSQYQVQCYGVADGLPQGSVQDILPLDDGSLLLGTNRGVVSFDGARASPLLLDGKPVLTDVQVHRMARWGDEVWVASFDGVYRMHQNAIAHYTMSDGLPQDRATGILPVADGVYIGTHGGSAYMARTADGFARAQVIGDMRASEFDLDTEGQLWVAALNGAWRRSANGSWSMLTEGASDIVWSTLSDHLGRRWFGTRTRLAEMVGGELKTVSTERGLPAQPVRAIWQDRNRQLWFATAGAGLYRLRGERFERVPRLSSDVVFAVTEDREGNLWAGTSSGVCRVRDGALMNFGLAEGIGTDFVLSIHAAPDGVTYVGSNGRGLYAIERGQVRSLGNPGGDPFVNYLTGIHDAASNEQRLLVSSNAGSFWYDPTLGFQPVHADLGRRPIAWAAQDGDGVIWLRSGNKALERLAKGELKEYALDDGGPPRWGFVGRTGEVWLTTTKALYRARGERIERVLGLPPSPVAACQIEDVDGMIWCTSSEGILRVNMAQATVQTIRDPAMGQLALLALLEDDAEGLWIASTAGLFHARRSELASAAAAGSLTLRRFDERHGMRSSEFTRAYAPGLASRAPDGGHWWATLGGVLLTDPARLTEVRTPPSVAVLRLRADGEVVHQQQWQRLPAGSRRIEIDFGARSLTDAASLQVRYRLLPISEEWTESQGRQFSALGLPSGSYRFEVQASIDRRQWQLASSAFAIDPHWYQRWWARFAMIALGVLLVITVPLWRIMNLRRRASELSQLVDERTNALQLANRQLDRIARTDALTGTANRRRFDEALMELAQQSPRPVSLLLADVDHFKRYNDTYGHPEGDECLRNIALAMQSVLPEKDTLLARYGGEEFAVLLSGAQDPSLIADALRAAVRSLALPHQGNPPEHIVTISVGLARSSGLGETVEHLLKRADDALYQAKCTGRDRVCAAH